MKIRTNFIFALILIALSHESTQAQTPPSLKFISNDGSILTLNPPSSPPSASMQLQGTYQDNTYRPKCQKSAIPVTVTINFSGPMSLPSSLNFTANYCDNAKKAVTGDFNSWTPGQQTVSFAASYTITGSSTYTANNPLPKAPNHPLQVR